MALDRMACPTGFLESTECTPSITNTPIWYLDAGNNLVSGNRRKTITCSPGTTTIECFDALGAALAVCPTIVSVSFAVTTGSSGGTATITPTPAYAAVYRLAYDQAGTATATTGANTPPGAVIGNVGNTVTIAGPIHSLSWKWLPATTPVPDLLNPPAILDPVVTVNGLAYVASVPNPLFSQSFSNTVESNLGMLNGDWTFTVADGAFIEITALKAA